MWKKVTLIIAGIFLLFGGAFFYFVKDTDKIYNNIMIYLRSKDWIIINLILEIFLMYF